MDAGDDWKEGSSQEVSQLKELAGCIELVEVHMAVDVALLQALSSDPGMRIELSGGSYDQLESTTSRGHNYEAMQPELPVALCALQINHNYHCVFQKLHI